MMRKLNLIILIFISMILIPLPLYARSGRGGGHGRSGHGSYNRGSGGHGFSSHRGFRRGGFSGQRRGGYDRIGSRESRGHSQYGHKGFDKKRYGYKHSGQFHDKDHKHYGHKDSDHKHHHHGHSSSSFFFGLGFGAVYPVLAYPYYSYPYYSYPYYAYPYYPYPSVSEASYGDLEIQATPGDVEIYVDGRFIGLAGDFGGPAVLLVPYGNHVVEFRYDGLRSSTSVYVAPDSKSAVSQEFEPVPPQSSGESVAPPSYQ